MDRQKDVENAAAGKRHRQTFNRMLYFQKITSLALDMKGSSHALDKKFAAACLNCPPVIRGSGGKFNMVV